MTPPAGRRRGRPASRRTAPGRRAAAGRGLSRRDLESLLAQLDAGGPRRDPTEAARLRRRLAEAIAAEEKAATGAGDQDGDQDEEEDDDEEDDGWYGDSWDPWASRWWRREAPAKPVPVEGGLTTKSKRGAIGETWWSQRFLAAIEAVMEGGRTTRGRSYARKGQVIDLSVAAGTVEAHVQGSRASPYRVRLSVSPVDDTGWDRIVEELGAQAGYAARLLAGEPHEIEEVFAAGGASLFPSSAARLITECTCPDWANPCKHAAAVCYLVAEAFDRDPFALLAWRGRTREQLLGRLRAVRAAATATDPALAPARQGPPAAAPPVPFRPLADCRADFWKAGAALAQVRARPEAADLPGAVLRHLAPGLIEVGGRDVAELLAPAYAEMAAGAASRALDPDDVPGRRPAPEKGRRAKG